MESKITKRDIEKCMKFAVEYHLDEKKQSANRTTGQYRGLGGLFDSFIIGKLIEIGVARIIDRGTRKKSILDFSMWDNVNSKVSEPDISKIKQRGKEREPNIYVEIKNISPNDRWIGLTLEQFKTIKSDKIAGNNPKNIFLIYASLHSKSEDKDLDPLGVYLKDILKKDLFKDFCKPKEMYVKIHYILSGEELSKKGTRFDTDSFMYETDVIRLATDTIKSRILDSEKRSEYTKKVKIRGKKLPVIMRNDYKPPHEFGVFKIKGNVEVYRKDNDSSQREYILAKSKATITNKVLGDFLLEKGKVYECFFETVGLNPTLKRNNLWIANRNLNNVVSKSVKQRIKEIRKKI
jgi:hypothetical protein